MRWSRLCAARWRRRSPGSTGFHRERRARDCSTASGYDARSRARPSRPGSARSRRAGVPAQRGNASSQHHLRAARPARDVRARVVLVDHQVGAARPRSAPAGRSHARAPQVAADSASAAGQTGLDQLGDLRRDQPVRQRAAGVRADVDRHAGVVGGRAPCRSGGRAGRACARPSAGTWPRRPPAMAGKVAMLTSVGTIATPCAGEQRRWCRSVSPVACSTQSMPASTRSRSESSAKQCAVTRAPSACAAAIAAASASARPAGGQVAGVAVDPVADQLDPAVAAAGLLAHVRRRGRSGSISCA